MNHNERKIVDHLAARMGCVFVPREQQASKDDVPRLLTEAEARELWYDNQRTAGCFIDALRERGLIAPEPVDPLRVAVEEAVAKANNAPRFIEALTAELRARAVTVDPTRAGEG